jgi:hypothetical protein
MRLLPRYEKIISDYSQMNWRFANIIKRSSGEKMRQVAARDWKQLRERIGEVIDSMSCNKRNLIIHQYDYIRTILKCRLGPTADNEYAKQQKMIKRAASTCRLSPNKSHEEHEPKKSFSGSPDSFRSQSW